MERYVTSQIRRLNIDMSVVLKLIIQSTQSQSKSQQCFCRKQTKNADSKPTWKCKERRISNTTLKKNKFGGLTLPQFKSVIRKR